MQINYEKFMNIIPQDKKIREVMTKIINSKASNKKLEFSKHISDNGYEFTVFKKDSKIYSCEHWFYPPDYKLHEDNFSVYPYKFYDINTTALLSLYSCGSINAYKIRKDIRVLFVDKSFINKVIDKILNPLINNKNTKHKKYYEYVKLFLQDKEKDIKSNEIKGDSWTVYFLSYISKILKFDGLLYLNNGGLYNNIENNMKIVLNRKSLFVRDGENKYDWMGWNIDTYILPIHDFVLNVRHFLSKNTGFKAYDFYRESLQASIKITEEYDFCTLNINNLISINKLYDKDRCMKELINFIKLHKLKFMCLQDIKYKDTRMFNKFIAAENMYTSVGDFEKQYFKDEDLCNIIVSTSNIIILNNGILPSGKEHFILFKHPNYKKKTFLNTKLTEKPEFKTEQLNTIAKTKADYIMGTLNIIKGTTEYITLKDIGYALNSDQVYGTTIDNIQTDYILSKIPKVMKSVVTVNYKFSDHKSLLGKI